MNVSVVLVVVILCGIIYYKFKSNIPEINKLEKEKQPLVNKVAELETERTTLKDKATEQEANATEQHKEDFWKNYTKDDK